MFRFIVGSLWSRTAALDKRGNNLQISRTNNDTFPYWPEIRFRESSASRPVTEGRCPNWMLLGYL